MELGHVVFNDAAICKMPKAAWTSLRAACVDAGGSVHDGVPYIARRICVVRHPYDRVRSWWQDKRATWEGIRMAWELFNAPETENEHISSQSWLVDNYDATEIWRYEDLAERWKEFAGAIPLLRVNAARQHKYGIEYVLDDEMRRLIRTRYVSDFKRFGFQP